MLGSLMQRVKGFGFGLSGFIPLVVYYTSGLVAFLSIFVNPLIGLYFLFPLLPYQSVFTKITHLPLGKDVNDIIIIAILLGWLIKGGVRAVSKPKTPVAKEYTTLNASVVFLAIVATIGLGVALMNPNAPVAMEGRSYLSDWKNYLLFPLIWFLTVNVIKDRKGLRTLSILLVLGIFGVSRYFYSNLGWMNVYHYSDRTKDMMSGLFVYLGANHYGAFFAHYIFMLIGFMFLIKAPFKKIVLLGTIWLTGYCLLFTFSRGAYLALVAGLFFIAVVRVRWLLIVLLLAGVSWKSIVPVAVRERIEMTKDAETGELEESAAIRVQLWEHAKEMFFSSPIVGQGISTFQFIGFRDTHNFYMKMLAESGILGLISFLFLLYASFMIAWKLYKEATDNFYKGLGLGFSACVISVALTNAFGDRWSYLPLGAYYWVFLGIVTKALLLTMEEKARLQDKKSKKPFPGRKILEARS